MKRILILLIALFLLISPTVFADNAEPTIPIEVEEEIKVLKFPYGVSIELAEDERLPIEWWHTISFDVSQDLNTKILRSFLGFSFGNSITDFAIGYSREFNDPELDDWGTASFSFTWSF